jgi:hypothetical protein
MDTAGKCRFGVCWWFVEETPWGSGGRPARRGRRMARTRVGAKMDEARAKALSAKALYGAGFYGRGGLGWSGSFRGGRSG